MTTGNGSTLFKIISLDQSFFIILSKNMYLTCKSILFSNYSHILLLVSLYYGNNKDYTFMSCNLAASCSTAKFLVTIKEDLHIGHICNCTLHGLHMWCPFIHWTFVPCVVSKHTGHCSNSSNASHHWNNQNQLWKIYVFCSTYNYSWNNTYIFSSIYVYI